MPRMTNEEKLKLIAEKAGYRVERRWRNGIPCLDLVPVRKRVVVWDWPVLASRTLCAIRRLARAANEVEGEP